MSSDKSSIQDKKAPDVKPGWKRNLITGANAVGTYFGLVGVFVLLSIASNKLLAIVPDHRFLVGAVQVLLTGAVLAACFLVPQAKTRWPPGVWWGAAAFAFIMVVEFVMTVLV